MAEAPQPKKVKLVDFSAASAFYGSRKGYVFKTGDQGLGYYLDNVDKAKERVLEGLEGPGLFARAPCVDVEAPETVKAPVPAPAEEPPKKKKRFDPFADLPPPKKRPRPHQKAAHTTNRRRKPRSRCLLPVYSSWSRSTACTSSENTRTRGTRRPGAILGVGSTARARTRRTNLEKIGAGLLAGMCSVSLFFERRGDGVSRRWRIRGLGHGLGRGSAVGSRLRSELGRELGRRAAKRERPHAFSETPHPRERHRHHTPSTRKTPHATQRRRTGAARSSRSSPRSSRSAARRRRAATSACSGAGKMSAAFELAAFNLDVHGLSKTVGVVVEAST